MYPFRKIEAKWAKFWQKNKIYQPNLSRAKNPFYNLMMFPYPSAEGLHVGNMYAFTGSDIYGRFMRMKGKDVFEPIGLDGFGIHSENYALKIGAHPMKQAKVSEKNFYRQLGMIGNGFAWDNRLETYDPEYYRWTQWIFLQLFKNGLAYRGKAPVNWCPSCKTVLADEQVIAGKCERCDNEVVKKNLEQWFFRITEYAGRLLKNLDKIDWPDRIKASQRNWIGKSEGASIRFSLVGKPSCSLSPDFLEVFTTRPDTIFGATFLVLSPEHPFLTEAESVIGNLTEVKKYVVGAEKKSETERQDETAVKTGVELKGIRAVNPATGKEVPIWISDYVLSGYGTGAIMAVPAHDNRDFDFAKKFKLPIVEVVRPEEPFTCLLIHGFTADGKRGWFSWLKNNLEKIGWKVFAPDLPETNSPRREDWQEELLKFKNQLNERSVIVGHSLGAKAALDLLEEIDKKIDKLILVAPVSPVTEAWKTLKRDKKRADVDAAENFSRSNPNNWQKIQGLASRIIVYYSDNDEYISAKDIDFYRKNLPQASFRLIKGRYHFNEGRGIKDFPEILEELRVPFEGKGKLINSGEFSGQSSDQARKGILEAVKGKNSLRYRLRDWLISRQRYWGPPIPLVFCENCRKKIEGISRSKAVALFSKGELENPGWIAVSEKDLPVKLPYLEDFRPSGKGESPLAKAPKFYRVRCPKCGEWARRETDVSDTFLDSAWYFLRYPSTSLGTGSSRLSSKLPWNAKITKKWLPVDRYIGGAEHAVLHLLYSRFLTMTLKDFGWLDFEEPFTSFRTNGLIIREGRKMSKSKGNVVNPDEYIQKFGADALRMHLMFLGPFEEGGDFRDEAINGITRFLNRVWRLADRLEKQDRVKKDIRSSWLNEAIKKIGGDIAELHYNTAIAELMTLLNRLEVESEIKAADFRVFLQLLAPFAPFLTEELWFSLGEKKSVHLSAWPKYDEKKIGRESFTLIVQINGRVRDKFEVESGLDKDRALTLVLARPKIKRQLGQAEIVRTIFVPGRLINLVIK